MNLLFLTVPNIQGDHQRAGGSIRVSRDGKKMAQDDYANLLGDHHHKFEEGLRNPYTVLGNPLMTHGRLYWEVEATHAAGDCCSFRFGVMSSETPGYHYPGSDGESWTVDLECDNSTTTIRMLHANQCLHEEVCNNTSGQHANRYGLLMDIQNRSLSVIDHKSSHSIFAFTNLNTSRGVTPVFAFDYFHKSTLRLVDPDEIQHAPLLPFVV